MPTSQQETPKIVNIEQMFLDRHFEDDSLLIENGIVSVSLGCDKHRLRAPIEECLLVQYLFCTQIQCKYWSVELPNIIVDKLIDAGVEMGRHNDSPLLKAY